MIPRPLAIVLLVLGQVVPVEAVEQGTASWYSTASCRREGRSGTWTASGDRFDENALTCAMPSRTFGGRYLVCRVDDPSRCVVVRHTDYGPNKTLVAQGRVIDLSKGAFAQLASLTRGLLDVTVEPVP